MSSSHSDGDLSPNASARLPDHSPSAAGYPRLADFMSKAPETQIFRSFSHLNILNVLRLQAELHSLGQQLAAFQRNNPEHTRNFWAMRMNKEDGIEDEQGDLLELIDAKLERYSRFVGQSLPLYSHADHFQTPLYCSYISSVACRPP